MPSTIQSQTISAVTDQCIALASSQFGRLHGFGDSWNTLRVAISIAVEDTGANIPGVVFRLGLCHGTTNMPGDVTTDNSYGLEFITGFQRNAGPPVNYSQLASPVAFRRVGSTETTGATNMTYGVIGAVNVCRQVIFVDIIKGSPNYTFKVFYKYNLTSTVDIPPASFLAQVPLASPSLSNYTYQSPTGTSLAIDIGANGILDTVYCGWNLLSPRIFIGNLAVVRLA